MKQVGRKALCLAEMADDGSVEWAKAALERGECSKSELKKRIKRDDAAAKKAKKAEEKAKKEAEKAAQGGDKPKLKSEAEETDPSKYFENRCKSLAKASEDGVETVPA